MREHQREGKGRSDTTWGLRRRKRQTAVVSVVVEGEVTGHPQMNDWHRKMRQDAVSVLVCSGRQEVVWLGRIRRWKLVGDEAVRGQIAMDWRRARGRKQRGTREESLAFKRVWSGGVNRTALKRIDEAINRQ